MTATGVVGALDIGGTHVTAGRVQLSSATVEPDARVRLEFTRGTTLLTRILEAADSVATPETRRFGVAAPGPFDYDAGVCLVSHKLPGLYGINLRRELAMAVGLTGRAVSFLNDAEAFLLGEWWAGAARGHTRALGITLGTGLGSAFLEEGRFVRSGRVPADGALYTLAFRGRPVEQTISRGALLARYGAGRDGDPDVEQIAVRARAGEARARRVFEELAADLGEFLAAPLEAFDPTCLVVGGSIAHAWDQLESTLVQALATCRPLVVARAVNIDDAPLLGAARHAADSEVNP
jgi:glucokinase